MKTLLRLGLVAVSSILGASLGSVQAQASPLGAHDTVLPGNYSVNRPRAPLAFFDVLKGGREIGRDAGVTCTSGAQPSPGIPASHPVFVEIPRPVMIGPRRTFTYDGTANVLPLGSYGKSATTHLAFKVRFIYGRRAREVKGSFASGACASPARTSFVITLG